jgi:peptidoglycan/LPS O-acetylase OafA/YrhL
VHIHTNNAKSGYLGLRLFFAFSGFLQVNVLQQGSWKASSWGRRKMLNGYNRNQMIDITYLLAN